MAQMGSNHAYKEFEMNAINSTWSLSLNRPCDTSPLPCTRRSICIDILDIKH